MRIRISETMERPFHNMWALFDVVLLQLIFFVLTLRIADPEGVHQVTVQANEQVIVQPNEEDIRCFLIPDIHVELKTANDGTLAAVLLDGRKVGAGREGLDALGREISHRCRQLCEVFGPDIVAEFCVVIEADFNLKYEYTVQAIGQCSTERSADGQLIPLGPQVRIATLTTVTP